MPDIIELFSYAQSPYAAKVHACLNAKGVDFSVNYVNPIRVKKEIAFSGQLQIPVVRYGNVVKQDSTPICLWLDENFSGDIRLIPNQAGLREQVLAIDNWIALQLIPSSFKLLMHSPAKQRRHNFWRLANTLNHSVSGGLNPLLRLAWPWLVPQASFIRQMLDKLDASESATTMRKRMYQHLIDTLDGKPFLVAGDSPTLADLAAYPQIINLYEGGLEGFDDFLSYPELVEWLRRVSPFAESTLPLLPASCKKRHFV